MAYDTIGRDISRTFLVPENDPIQYAKPTTGRATRGGGSTKPAAGPEMPDIGSKLQNVEGVTREYYQKYQELRTYAQNMWKQYGIDVTSPDYSSQEAMNAAITFQKGVADLNYTSDRLGNSQRMLEDSNSRREQAVIDGKGYIDPQYNPSAQFFDERTPDQGFQSNVVPEADEFNSRFGGKKYDPASGAYKQAIGEYNRVRNYLMQQATSLQQSNPEEANRLMNAANQMVKPVVTDLSESSRSKADKTAIATKRLQFISSVLAGENIDALKASPLVSDVALNAEGDIVVYEKGGDEKVIKRNGGDAALFQVNRYLNTGDERDLAFDDLANLNPSKVKEISDKRYTNYKEGAPAKEIKDRIVSDFANIPPMQKGVEFDLFDKSTWDKKKREPQATASASNIAMSSINSGGWTLPTKGGKGIAIDGVEYDIDNNEYIFTLAQGSPIASSDLEDGETIDGTGKLKVKANNSTFFGKLLDTNSNKLGDIRIPEYDKYGNDKYGIAPTQKSKEYNQKPDAPYNADGSLNWNY